MGTINSLKSVLTQSVLDVLCEKFYIPDAVHPELPGPNARIRNSPTGKIGNFRRFYINSKNKGWMSFSKRAENALHGAIKIHETALISVSYPIYLPDEGEPATLDPEGEGGLEPEPERVLGRIIVMLRETLEPETRELYRRNFSMPE
ncbi:hypothetical protein Tco_0057833 [Tanacetum coccineum]